MKTLRVGITDYEHMKARVPNPNNGFSGVLELPWRSLPETSTWAEYFEAACGISDGWKSYQFEEELRAACRRERRMLLQVRITLRTDC